MRRFVLFLALRHVRRRPLQSVLTVAGVAVGVMVLITALSLTNGFIDELIGSTLQATPHVTLQPFDAGLLPEDERLLAELAEHPDVVAVAPFLSSQALIARRANAQAGVSGRQGFTQLFGIDPARTQLVLDLPELELATETLANDEGIILGESLALRQLGVYPGDNVTIREIGGRTATFSVADTFWVGNELIDNVTSYLSIEALQEFLDTPGMISGFHVRVTDPEQASQVGMELASRFGLLSTSWERLFRTLIEQLRLQRVVIGVVVFLIVVVAAMGIANILVITVNEKTEEIAILRALGASRRQILSVFTLEGLLLGGGGTVIGALLGVAISLYFRYQPYPLPGDLYFITRLPVELRVGDLVWVCGLSLLTSVVAGLLPARRAADLQPSEVLR